ncbi:hypothetical protein RO3G_08828 [Rhizopus delemar RA 99-880]|uniref:Uncharacterized protein n=1 Tax=Rhizopus delemar (strain RA 99-880 / ATCC MYA-4621 / FGSC 9543 / NRRL 43880) TaxID=246409 RepID=I1C6N8_RHIO9|nr:hypothetical protein RO3G_08828 [Rhizopus delemar RA 99-880]|eukprot:EIE84118.1 hypothetical protein RO3G_08828 [Rhizopus delemar RA 99-880]
MIEVSSSNDNTETLSPEDFINKLRSQKAAMLKIIDSINDQNIQFVMQNNFDGLKSNDKKLAFATKSLERFDKLIADQVNIISLNSAMKEAPVLHHINNKYIPSKELPKFNVNPTASAMYQLTQHSGNKNNNNATNEPSLEMFLRGVERAFRDHNVSIQDHWLSNLEICFESGDNNLHYDWFCHYVKKIVELKRKVICDDAKALSQEKFHLASQTTPQTWMKLLLNFKQRPDQSLADALYHFRRFSVGAKVPFTEGHLINSLFVSRLYTTKFQDTVMATITNHTKHLPITEPAYPDHSIHAPCNASSPLNMTWDNFEAILMKNMVNLESSLLSIQKEMQREQVKKPTNDNYKKRKLPAFSPSIHQRTIPVKTLPNSNNNNGKYNDFYEKIADLKRRGICTFCESAKYTTAHTENCAQRKRYDQRKSNKHNNKSSETNNFHFSTISSQNNNVSSDSPSCDSSEGEYNRIYKEFDRSLITPYLFAHFDVETSSDVNVFALRNNHVGDINNPFNSDSVSFPPVTLMTLNGVNAYGIIGAGANVSVVNKKLANDNNIEFNTVSAVKHKSTEKEIDDSIVDKAYEPNISRAGTDKEQKTFDLAIKSYIEANKKLNKNTLCNMEDAVLHLPTPESYAANVKQYPIPYSVQPKVIEIINSWLDDGIIAPTKTSALYLC